MWTTDLILLLKNPLEMPEGAHGELALQLGLQMTEQLYRQQENIRHGPL